MIEMQHTWEHHISLRMRLVAVDLHVDSHRLIVDFVDDMPLAWDESLSLFHCVTPVIGYPLWISKLAPNKTIIHGMWCQQDS